MSEFKECFKYVSDEPGYKAYQDALTRRVKEKKEAEANDDLTFKMNLAMNFRSTQVNSRQIRRLSDSKSAIDTMNLNRVEDIQGVVCVSKSMDGVKRVVPPSQQVLQTRSVSFQCSSFDDLGIFYMDDIFIDTKKDSIAARENIKRGSVISMIGDKKWTNMYSTQEEIDKQLKEFGKVELQICDQFFFEMSKKAAMLEGIIPYLLRDRSNKTTELKKSGLRRNALVTFGVQPNDKEEEKDKDEEEDKDEAEEDEEEEEEEEEAEDEDYSEDDEEDDGYILRFFGIPNDEDRRAQEKNAENAELWLDELIKLDPKLYIVKFMEDNDFSTMLTNSTELERLQSGVKPWLNGQITLGQEEIRVETMEFYDDYFFIKRDQLVSILTTELALIYWKSIELQKMMQIFGNDSNLMKESRVAIALEVCDSPFLVKKVLPNLEIKLTDDELEAARKGSLEEWDFDAATSSDLVIEASMLQYKLRRLQDSLKKQLENRGTDDKNTEVILNSRDFLKTTYEQFQRIKDALKIAPLKDNERGKAAYKNIQNTKVDDSVLQILDIIDKNVKQRDAEQVKVELLAETGQNKRNPHFEKCNELYDMIQGKNRELMQRKADTILVKGRSDLIHDWQSEYTKFVNFTLRVEEQIRYTRIRYSNLWGLKKLVENNLHENDRELIANNEQLETIEQPLHSKDYMDLLLVRKNLLKERAQLNYALHVHEIDIMQCRAIIKHGGDEDQIFYESVENYNKRRAVSLEIAQSTYGDTSSITMFKVANEATQLERTAKYQKQLEDLCEQVNQYNKEQMEQAQQTKIVQSLQNKQKELLQELKGGQSKDDKDDWQREFYSRVFAYITTTIQDDQDNAIKSSNERLKKIKEGKSNLDLVAEQWKTKGLFQQIAAQKAIHKCLEVEATADGSVVAVHKPTAQPGKKTLQEIRTIICKIIWQQKDKLPPEVVSRWKSVISPSCERKAPARSIFTLDLQSWGELDSELDELKQQVEDEARDIKIIEEAEEATIKNYVETQGLQTLFDTSIAYQKIFHQSRTEKFEKVSLGAESRYKARIEKWLDDYLENERQLKNMSESNETTVANMGVTLSDSKAQRVRFKTLLTNALNTIKEAIRAGVNNVLLYRKLESNLSTIGQVDQPTKRKIAGIINDGLATQSRIVEEINEFKKKNNPVWKTKQDAANELRIKDIQLMNTFEQDQDFDWGRLVVKEILENVELGSGRAQHYFKLLVQCGLPISVDDGNSLNWKSLIERANDVSKLTNLLIQWTRLPIERRCGSLPGKDEIQRFLNKCPEDMLSSIHPITKELTIVTSTDKKINEALPSSNKSTPVSWITIERDRVQKFVPVDDTLQVFEFWPREQIYLEDLNKAGYEALMSANRRLIVYNSTKTELEDAIARLASLGKLNGDRIANEELAQMQDLMSGEIAAPSVATAIVAVRNRLDVLNKEYFADRGFNRLMVPKAMAAVANAAAAVAVEDILQRISTVDDTILNLKTITTTLTSPKQLQVGEWDDAMSNAFVESMNQFISKFYGWLAPVALSDERAIKKHLNWMEHLKKNGFPYMSAVQQNDQVRFRVVFPEETDFMILKLGPVLLEDKPGNGFLFYDLPDGSFWNPPANFRYFKLGDSIDQGVVYTYGNQIRSLVTSIEKDISVKRPPIAVVERLAKKRRFIETKINEIEEIEETEEIEEDSGRLVSKPNDDILEVDGKLHTLLLNTLSTWGETMGFNAVKKDFTVEICGDQCWTCSYYRLSAEQVVDALNAFASNQFIKLTWEDDDGQLLSIQKGPQFDREIVMGAINASTSDEDDDYDVSMDENDPLYTSGYPLTDDESDVSMDGVDDVNDVVNTDLRTFLGELRPPISNGKKIAPFPLGTFGNRAPTRPHNKLTTYTTAKTCF